MHSYRFMLVSLVFIAFAPLGLAQNVDEVLISVVWQLQSLDGSGGKLLTPEEPSRYTLTFAADGRLVIQADCNRGVGRYLREGALLATAVAYTRALCPSGPLFDLFTRNLEGVLSLAIENGNLYLTYDGDAGVMIFTASPGIPDDPADDPVEGAPPVATPPDVSANQAQIPLTDACQTGLVMTASGAVCGTMMQFADGFVRAFKGIPYAETTAGDNRWRAPVPKAPWQVVLQAEDFGPTCPQNLQGNGVSQQSEDCLSINIWTPADRGANLPVLVFIHGGAFVVDSSASRLYEPDGPHLYDGSYLAATQNLVVVTFNYRLGALGFLGGVARLDGNYGFLDQQLALTWVQENIASFGGNPARVTLAGESAGAMSVGLHLLSAPDSDSLFSAAIMQSNPFGIPFKDLEEAKALGEIYLLSLGCWFQFDQAACLRNKPVEDILAAQGNRFLQLPVLNYGLATFLVWAPVINGKELIGQPLEIALQGNLSKPVLLGTNRDESVIFFPGSDPVGFLGYNLTVNLMFGGNNFRRILERYPLAADGDNRENLIQIATDFLFACSTQAVARAAQSAVYLYEFTHVPSFNLWKSRFPGCDDKSCHGESLAFVFGSAGGAMSFTPGEAHLAEMMARYWGGFASYFLDPNLNRATDTPQWPAFTSQILNLAIPITVTEPKAHQCDFWDSFGYTPFRLR